MAKARAIDAVALYEQIAAEVSSMLKQPPGIIVSKIMAMVLQAPTIGSTEAKEDVLDDRFDALAAPWARKIRAAFPAAFVNMYNELILIPKANTYIMLNQVRDEQDFKAAVLEDCSRNAFKGCSGKLRDEHLDGINKLLETKFTKADMELIYTYLGNGIQHDLCLRFVESGYDLEVLREYDKKQEAGSNGKTQSLGKRHAGHHVGLHADGRAQGRLSGIEGSLHGAPPDDDAEDRWTAERQAERPVLGQSGARQGDDHLRGYGPGSLRRVRGGRSMIEFIFFKIVVPVAAAMICGLLVWFVIDCLEASSWAEEDVKMPGFHVSAGIGGIYAGITNSKGEWKDRDRVTTEAVEAVRDYFLAIRETDGVDSMEYKWVTGDGSEVTLTLRKTVPENGGPNAE